MKKNGALIPFLAAATLSLSSATAVADPVRIQANFTCPVVELIAHFGNYIAGMGMEEVLTVHNPVYFKTIYYPVGVPANLSHYRSVGTDYNSTNGYVTCNYASSEQSEQPFDLTYYATNGFGGRIRAQTDNTIFIIFPLGARA